MQDMAQHIPLNTFAQTRVGDILTGGVARAANRNDWSLPGSSGSDQTSWDDLAAVGSGNSAFYRNTARGVGALFGASALFGGAGAGAGEGAAGGTGLTTGGAGAAEGMGGGAGLTTGGGGSAAGMGGGAGLTAGGTADAFAPGAFASFDSLASAGGETGAGRGRVPALGRRQPDAFPEGGERHVPRLTGSTDSNKSRIGSSRMRRRKLLLSSG